MKKTVYIVDDDDDVREIMLYALEHEGYLVQSFPNGFVALENLKNLTMGVRVFLYL